ncbi:amino acid adenylation domain-containing protein [Nonomuraea sp. NBC_01738]|uniref:non-ribosomal peptide synthetase n=1 Tax=Nonomuraea sp. NBC_01738 TaxID=2976003 RepID=UPI002E122A0C|nr:amino acid adenylation domain-containing protein [Nonomuraea sp. NBC_01738]
MGRWPQERDTVERAGHDPSAQRVGVFDGLRKACAALLNAECELAVTSSHDLAPALQGTLVLRLLDRALLDGDHVHRVLWPDDLTLEDGYPPVHLPADSRPRVIVWSGRTREEAESVRRGLASFFAGLTGERFADAVLTQQTGRAVHPVRGAIVAETPLEAAAVLNAPFSYGTLASGVTFTHDAPLDTGHLYGTERTFTEAFDEKDDGAGDAGRRDAVARDALLAAFATWGVADAGPGAGVTVELAGAWDRRRVAAELARIWVAGNQVDWPALDPDHPLQRVRIPAPARDLPEPMEPLRPLTAVPYAFWVLEELAPGTGVSNLAVAFRTRARLRRLPLQIAVTRLVKRHPALRLRFPVVDGAPARHLTAPQDAKITVVTRESTEDDLQHDLRAFLDEPFDLGQDLLVRAGHFLVGDGSVVCLVGHHMVVDAHSMQLLVEDLGAFYDSQTSQEPLPAALGGTAPMLEAGEPSRESVAYWLKALEGVDPERMVLPGSRPSPERPTFAGHTCSWQADDDTVRALEDLRTRLRTTGNIVLATAFLLTLRGHGAGPDLVFGMPVSTRAPGARHVGYGVSTLPLRVRVELDDDFEQVARRVEDAFADGVEHADASVEAVLTARGHGTGDWRVPLFRHMFNYRPWSDEQVRVCGEVPGYLEDLFDRSRLDLQCVAVQEPARLTIRLWHSTEVHTEAEMAAFTARMASVLRQAAARGRVSDVLSPADRALLGGVNATGRAWSGGLLDRLTPSSDVAVVEPAAGRTLTYGELLGWAAELRDRLLAQGVRRGDLVALALERSADLLAAVLGCWAAGAAFLPLDAHQPERRLSGHLTDSGARLLITADGVAPPWAAPEVPTITSAPSGDAEWEPLSPDPADIAYVIYTSGSTGRPKGVQVTHGNLANLVQDFAGRLEGRRVLWSTTPSFDISWLEAMLPPATGGTLVIAPDEVRLQAGAFLALIEDQDVEIVQATPTAWRMAVPEASGELAGRTVLCGGEPMPAQLARDLLELGCRVLNVYGPTETTIWSTVHELDEPPGDSVPVGAPLANTRVFIEREGTEAPPGVPGELCVAGDGVSAGYLGRPELTAERFGEHPLYGRFYRTGDRAVIRHDGLIELLGRQDRQIKLRGHRIELGEVEAALHEHDLVRAAAVILDGDPQGDGRLVAFTELTGDGDESELWAFARQRLPEYAVPTRYVMVDRLPTTENGKIAYRALTVPDEPGGQARPAQVDDGLRGRVVGLWREALGRPGLGEHDNFFLNGGHSVLAVRLVPRLEELAGGPVPVRAVFDHPTPAELAAFLGGAR